VSAAVYRVQCTEAPAPTSWVSDGDQDGDVWEGSSADAEQLAERLRRLNPDARFDVVQVKPTSECEHEYTYDPGWCVKCGPLRARALCDVLAARDARIKELEAELGQRCEPVTCCEPRRIVRHRGKRAFTTITLNEYQRSNLLWLLCDVAGYDRERAIVPHLQTGDWCGEVANALRCPESNGPYEESEQPPNAAQSPTRHWIEQSMQTELVAEAKALRRKLQTAVEALKTIEFSAGQYISDIARAALSAIK